MSNFLLTDVAKESLATVIAGEELVIKNVIITDSYSDVSEISRPYDLQGVILFLQEIHGISNDGELHVEFSDSSAHSYKARTVALTFMKDSSEYIFAVESTSSSDGLFIKGTGVLQAVIDIKFEDSDSVEFSNVYVSFPHGTETSYGSVKLATDAEITLGNGDGVLTASNIANLYNRFVTLNTNQTIGGSKTFSNALSVSNNLSVSGTLSVSGNSIELSEKSTGQNKRLSLSSQERNDGNNNIFNDVYIDAIDHKTINDIEYSSELNLGVYNANKIISLSYNSSAFSNGKATFNAPTVYKKNIEVDGTQENVGYILPTNDLGINIGNFSKKINTLYVSNVAFNNTTNISANNNNLQLISTTGFIELGKTNIGFTVGDGEAFVQNLSIGSSSDYSGTIKKLSNYTPYSSIIDYTPSTMKLAGYRTPKITISSDYNSLIKSGQTNIFPKLDFIGSFSKNSVDYSVSGVSIEPHTINLNSLNFFRYKGSNDLSLDYNNTNKTSLYFDNTENKLDVVGNVYFSNNVTANAVSSTSISNSGDITTDRLFFDSTIKFSHNQTGIDITGNLTPSATNTYDLGSSSYKFKNLHVGTVYADNYDGLSISSDKLIYNNSTKFEAVSNGSKSYGDILPSTSESYDLGSSSYKWNNIHVGTVYADHYDGLSISSDKLVYGSTTKLEAVSDGVKSYDTIYPSSNNSYNIGTTSSKFGTLFVNQIGDSNNNNPTIYVGQLYFGGSSYYMQQYASGVDLYGNLTPGSANTYDLGTSSYKWNNIYCNTIHATTIDGSVSSASTADTLSTSRRIGVQNFDGSADVKFDFNCTSSAETQSRTISASGYALTAGVLIGVWFKYAHSGNTTPTLNINSTGALNLVDLSGASITTWGEGTQMFLYYDSEFQGISNNKKYVVIWRSDTGASYPSASGTGQTVNNVIFNTSSYSMKQWSNSGTGSLTTTTIYPYSSVTIDYNDITDSLMSLIAWRFGGAASSYNQSDSAGSQVGAIGLFALRRGTFSSGSITTVNANVICPGSSLYQVEIHSNGLNSSTATSTDISIHVFNYWRGGTWLILTPIVNNHSGMSLVLATQIL